MRTPQLAAALAVVVSASGASTAAAAEAAYKRLGVEQATSTSYLQSNWNKYDENYHANYVLDDNPKTAWVEGVAGNGEGQSITLPVSDLKTARSVKVVVFNGYQKSAALLTANAAPKEVTFTVRDAAENVVATKKATLERKMGAQEVVIDIPAKRGVAVVSLEINSVHAGGAYKDTCISDIAVHVDSDVPYNEAVEKKKLQAARDWIKERVATAKAFAARPKTYPFASTHFNAVGDDDAWLDEPVHTWDDKGQPHAIAGRVGLADQIKSGKPSGIVGKLFSAAELKVFAGLGGAAGTYRLDSKDRTPLPDGLEILESYVPKDVVAAVAGPGATFFEGTNDTVKLGGGHTRSRYAVTFDDKDKKLVRTLAFHEREEISERETYTRDSDYLFRFDDKGLLVSIDVKTAEDYGSVSVAHIDLRRDDQQRVKSVSLKVANGPASNDAGTPNTTWTQTYEAQLPGA